MPDPRGLVRALAQQEQGRGPLVGASGDRITALRQLAGEQREALDGLLARQSDLDANLMGLSHEVDQGQLAMQTREWAEELDTYWKATAEVFRAPALAPGR